MMLGEMTVSADTESKGARMAEVLGRLHQLYPEIRCSLDFETPFQLLIATILAAQCTDERVNGVTPALFARYPSAATMAEAPLAELEELVRTTGFYRNKAKNIQGASRALVERHGGVVPPTLDALAALPGAGRKTANVVLGNAFGLQEGIAVDTHAGRLSRRLGFTAQDDPVKVEQELMALVPSGEWTDYTHLMIYHGRAVCAAKRPNCGACVLADLCPSAGTAGS